MPLDPQEAISLADEVCDLGQEIAAALKRDQDGKVRLTRREARRILRAAARLVLELAVAVAD